VMIGRGALGNPWMLYRTVEYLTKGYLPPEPTPREKIDIAILHLDRLIALKGEQVAVKEMRKHMAWYLRGLKGSARVKEQIMEMTTRESLVKTLYDYVERLEAGGEADERPETGEERPETATVLH